MDCIDQSVEIDDTLFLVYRFILILPISSIYIAIHLFIQNWKTEFVQPVNLFTVELQLWVEESNSWHFLKKSFKNSENLIVSVFKTGFKILFWWLILTRFVGAQFLTI